MLFVDLRLAAFVVAGNTPPTVAGGEGVAIIGSMVGGSGTTKDGCTEGISTEVGECARVGVAMGAKGLLYGAEA